MTRVLFKLLLLLLLVCTVCLQGQISANALKSAYLVKIANNFTWEISQEPIEIGVLSNSHDFYATLKKYAQPKNIGGRDINITLLQSPKAMDAFDVLYIGEEKNKNLSDFKKELEGRRTLLITNLAPNVESSMINFYFSHDQKIKFKINTTLLKRHQFEPSNLMLVLGGSENDILSLFEEKDSSIVFERNRSLKLKTQNSEQEKLLKKIEERMDRIKNSLIFKNQEIKNKSKEIKKINTELIKQKKRLKKIEIKIHSTSQKLEKKESKIKLQEQLISNQSSVFQRQQKEIHSRNNKIKSQGSILEKQENLLSLKEQYLNYAYIFSLALLGILLFAVINFLGKQKSNKELAIRNEKLKNTLETLQQTQAKLVQNEKMASLGMVTAGMAHEINNPMTFVYAGVNILKSEITTYRDIINGLIQKNNKRNNTITDTKTATLLSEYSDTQKSVDQTISDIEFGAKRVTDIVNSLQNFSRLNEDDVKTIDINEAIESTLKILGSHAKNKKITISTNINSSPLNIECFPASINQVLVNLISNSIDACPNKNGEINVKAEIIENICVIKIKDNGCGIEEKNFGKIFDPFFTTKTIGEGTGLGLSISYNIIKKHNGSITVENNINKGACFTLEIPKTHTNIENA
tara:strand:- start:7036 stop:8940 length:1905 start_codon:yes stop_codon:yes gene_type:complete